MRVHLRVKIGAWRLPPGFAVLLGAAAPESPYATCPECARLQVRLLAKPDRIDRVSRVPWSAVQRLLGGKLYRCSRCRLQFYDCRKPAPQTQSAVTGG